MVFTANYAGNHGAGFYAEGGAPLLRDCEFFANTAGSGGAIYVDGGSTPRIEGCLIHDNVAVGPGGGIAVEGEASPLIAGCTICGNSSGDGGGIYVGAARARIEFTIIRDNSSPFGAGASFTSSDEVTMSCVLLTGNQAAVWGGAISSAYTVLQLERATIVRNVSSGGAIVLMDGSIVVTDCIIEGNEAGSVFSLEGYCQAGIGYSDVWGNEGAMIAGTPPPGFGVVAFVNANGDSCDVYGNLLLDPVFMDPASGDFHLDFPSPCINAGDPSSPADPDGTAADMGAFPAGARLFLSARFMGATVELSWNDLPGSDHYWIFGAANDAYFLPGAASDFLFRVAVVPGGTTTWSTVQGVADPGDEWSYLVMAMQGQGWEMARSHRAGEREFGIPLPP
ncbi:right-handed parallel beta-helix repeat-containing protein [Candidatus Fermentibacteria bacterium]|nr:right-handed parallel beta-helix repeat-containing protein [Candidatus Fermentibacteria bacterium]